MIALMPYAPVAQWIEHRIPNPGVVGSNPAGCAPRKGTSTPVGIVILDSRNL